MRVLIAGCGWLGSAVGHELSRRGDHVIGIRRDPTASAKLGRLGIEPLRVDLTAADAAKRLPEHVQGIVACAAPGSDTLADYRRTYPDAVSLLLARYDTDDTPPSFVYVGSTGVFGQTDGGLVDERSATRPRTETARILVEAERQILQSGRGCVLRMSGLYGPGRYGVIDRVRTGRLALGPQDDRWMNFCHLEDAVRSVVAAVDRGRPATVYHASDAGPARRGEVIRWIASRAGFDPVVDETAPAAGGGGNRRITATWSRESLGVELAYRSFHEGLATVINRAS